MKQIELILDVNCVGVEVQGVIRRSVMESFVLQLGEAEGGQQEAHGAARREGGTAGFFCP